MHVAIFDIDGTLADCAHRRHHVASGARNWEAFFASMDLDPVIPSVAWLLASTRQCGVRVIICSGRPEKYRAVTEAWLVRHGIEFEHLYMRPDNDSRADFVVKRQILDGILADGYEPFFVVDDRPSVVQMWRDAGLMCLQVNHNEEDTSSTVKPGILTLMVGPSGAGKSTMLADESWRSFIGIKAAEIVSSDGLRAELCGDFKDQSKNDQVFAALRAIVKARLHHGLNVVVDATNIRNKDRSALTDLQIPDAPIRYVVVDRPIEQKRLDGGWRNEIAGFDLIGKHDQTFRSNLKAILAGDNLPNVLVIDLRQKSNREAA